MSKINNGGLDQYGAEPYEQQQFVTAGVGGVNISSSPSSENPYILPGMVLIVLEAISTSLHITCDNYVVETAVYPACNHPTEHINLDPLCQLLQLLRDYHTAWLANHVATHQALRCSVQ